MEAVKATPASPDTHGAGLTAEHLSPLRYDSASEHRLEVGGIMNDLMDSGVRVLDVGCGTGSVTVAANRGKNNTVTAIEPDMSRAAAAAHRGLDVYNGVLNEVFIAEKGQFDVVMLADVLEHVASPDALMRIVMRAVRSGGFILISVPNVAHWSVRLNLLRGHFDYEPVGIMDATHLRWFTERSLRALLDSIGLRIVRIRHSAGVDLPVYKRGLIRFVPYRLRSPVIRGLCVIFPRLFGAQLVMKAEGRNIEFG
jgi:methionine biosynthesis protein MetW